MTDLFLFNDLVLLTKATEAGYDYHHHFPLQGCVVAVHKEGVKGHIKHAVEIRKPGYQDPGDGSSVSGTNSGGIRGNQPLILVAESSRERDLWVRDLADVEGVFVIGGMRQLTGM